MKFILIFVCERLFSVSQKKRTVKNAYSEVCLQEETVAFDEGKW